MIDRGNQDWRLTVRPTLDFAKGGPRSVQFDDDYYSPESGLAESRYVFMDGGDVVERMKSLNANDVLTIVELGVGTGLNLALLLQAWSDAGPLGARCHYIGIEKHPLAKRQLESINAAWTELETFTEILTSRWAPPVPGCHRRPQLIDGFDADFWWEDAERALGDLRSHGACWVDLWLLDGFTPARNATMWSKQVIDALAAMSRRSASVATFTAAGSVRRALEAVGFSVSKRPGFGGKRECITAQRVTDATTAVSASPSHSVTPWDLPQNRQDPEACLIIGAGLAGCHIARALAERGCQVTLLEAGTLASGGSTQPQGVIYTRPSHKHGKLTDFSLSAYCFATDHHKQQFAENALRAGIDGELSGYIQLSDDATQARLRPAFSDIESPVQMVTRQEASAIAGIPLERGGLHFPDSGWLHPTGVCEALVRHPNIRLIEGLGAVTTERLENASWCARTAAGHAIAVGDTVVVTTAWQACEDPRLAYLPLQPIRGQTTQVPSEGTFSDLTCTVCHAGYTPPARLGHHCIGATYGLNETALDERLEDHATNVEQLAANVPALSAAWAPETLKGTAAIRCATADYLPIVGSAPDHDAFCERYADLRHDRKRFIDAPQPNIAGFWVFTGLGSRGLTSAPILAELLVSLMFNRPPPLARYLIQAVSPARFLRRKLIKGDPC